MMTLNSINNDFSKSVYVVMVVNTPYFYSVFGVKQTMEKMDHPRVKWATGENGPPQHAMVR